MENNGEVLKQIDSTESFKLLLNANQEFFLDLFYDLYENLYHEEIEVYVKKVWARMGIFVGSAVSLIGCALLDYADGMAISATTGAYGLLTSCINFLEVAQRTGICRRKAVDLYNELITADETLFKSIERGRFVSDTLIQERVREELQFVITKYNESMPEFLAADPDAVGFMLIKDDEFQGVQPLDPDMIEEIKGRFR